MKKFFLFCFVASLLTGCVASGPSVGDYAIGDDSAAIKGGRNRKAEMEQHRRQRQNTSEEIDLEAKKRQNSQEKVNGGIRAVGGILDVANKIRWLGF
jgi:hypothetical protein